MNPELPIVLVDDEESALRSYQFILNREGFNNLVLLNNGQMALDYLAESPAALVVLDLIMPVLNGIDALPQIVERFADVPVIILTGIGDVQTVVSCMKMGAFDFMTKPVEPVRLVNMVKHTLSLFELEEENRRLHEQFFEKQLLKPELFRDIYTENKRMIQIFHYIEATANSRHPVMITGETGTGKELIARAIHDTSGRKGDFVAVNAAGLDDTMFADTLFGHYKGAFTGADRKRDGLIQKAVDGTLFLDEIGDLSVASQIKLLRLIQESQYYPMGADSPLKSNARIVVATNRSVSDLKASETFRKDLFYRLKTYHIELPPLRERYGDIEVLFERFWEEALTELEKPTVTVPRSIFPVLNSYDFPGNIREMKGMVQEAASLCQNPDDLVQFFQTIIQSGQIFCDVDEAENQANPFSAMTRLPSLEEMETLLIHEALNRTGGNKFKSAEILGISRQTLHRKVR